MQGVASHAPVSSRREKQDEFHKKNQMNSLRASCEPPPSVTGSRRARRDFSRHSSRWYLATPPRAGAASSSMPAESSSASTQPTGSCGGGRLALSPRRHSACSVLDQVLALLSVTLGCGRGREARRQPRKQVPRARAHVARSKRVQHDVQPAALLELRDEAVLCAQRRHAAQRSHR